MTNKFLLSEAHKLLREGADVSVLDELDGLTHQDKVDLIEKYIRFERVYIWDPARKLVNEYMTRAKESNKRIKNASIYLSKLINKWNSTNLIQQSNIWFKTT